MTLVDSQTEAQAAYNLHSNAKTAARTRSKLSNGRLLPMTDGRSATARRFKDLYQDICGDLGGADLLSEGQKQLIRRAAMLSAECERLEAFAVRDVRPGQINWKDEAAFSFDIDTYGVLCDRLGRLFDRLGLERRAKPVRNSVIEHFSSPARQKP